MAARAVVFDMDGVLVDSEPLHLVATNRVLAACGASLSESENQAYLGWNEAAYWADLVRRFGLPGAPEGYSRARRRAFFELLAAGVPVAPGVPDVLAGLRARGLGLGVASSSDREVILHVLRTAGLLDRFAAVAAGDEVSRSKPDPEVFLLAARRLGVPPGECLAFEDSPHGIESALRAGMRCVRVVTATTRGLACPPTHHLVDGLVGLDVDALL